MAESPWFVYIIRTENDKLYTGISTDVERRFREHQEGRLGAKFFQTSAPAQLVFTESHADRSAASRREAEIKSMDREAKLALVTAFLLQSKGA